MKFIKSNLIIITGIVLLFLYGCATNYTIQLLDEENQSPVPGVPIEILDENGKDQLMLDESNSDGQFEFPLKDIPGDSFLVTIAVEKYFEENEWIPTPKKSAGKKFILEKRVTIITGYVLVDNSTYNGIQDCEITTEPSITKSVFTDKEGKFIIKSDEFAEGVSYSIFASKLPDYIPSATEITPNIDEKNDLEYSIYLERIGGKEDKGNLPTWRYRIGDISYTYYVGEKYDGGNTDLWLETVAIGRDPKPDNTEYVTIKLETENSIEECRVNDESIIFEEKSDNLYAIKLKEIPSPGEQLNIDVKLYPQNTILLNIADMFYHIKEEIRIPEDISGPTGTRKGTFNWHAYNGNIPRTERHSSASYQEDSTLTKQWGAVWLESVQEYQINADERTVVKTTNEILEVWVGDNQIKDIIKNINEEYELNLDRSINLNGKVFIKFKVTNKIILSSFRTE